MKAIVLLNMGGPNNLHEVELFLKNMFNDKHIISVKSDRLRRFIAGTITTLRAEKAQDVYRQLGNKSPLVGYTNELIKAIKEASTEELIVLPAMRYTPPYASEAIIELQKHDISELILFPMYPQHSTTTTASSVEDFMAEVDKANLDVKTTIISSYYKNDNLNEAIAQSIEQKLGQEDSKHIDLVFSAHGLPQKIVDKGDLYEKQVEEHVALLKEKLRNKGISFNSVSLAYQSKVGPMKWIEPSLEQSLLVHKSNKRILIYPIAFTIDNSETEYELVIEYEEIAKEMGYEYYEVVPALNSHPLFVKAILELCL